MSDEYTGFHFPMGAFLIWNKKEVLMGKCDPLTKEILNIRTIPDSDGISYELPPEKFKAIKIK